MSAKPPLIQHFARFTRVKADLPFGGVRRVGYGRELPGLSIKEFVNHRLIDVIDIDAPF